MNWYLLAFQKYADFSSRSRRSEYWYFVLFNLLAVIVLAMIGGITSEASDSSIGLIPFFIYYLAALVPSLAVSVRRLHDTSRSGWWLLISLVPLVGSIVLLVFYCEDSHPGTNNWGPNPKDPESHINFSDDPTIIDDLV